MTINDGKCKCGNVEATLKLPRPLNEYSPRQCDCDFCITRNISYVSDPEGLLELRCQEKLEIQKQGSEQADFLTCPNCKTVIAASINLKDKLLGALNANVLSKKATLKPSISVSPKKLGAKGKVKRWETVWLNILINNEKSI